MMWQSLLKLRALPDDTRLYCGHEYTAANVRFALTVEPDNTALRRRADAVTQLIGQGEPTIPTTLAEEKAMNPFLRADLPAVAAGVGLAGAPPAEVFAAVRGRKDRF
jgi:hydroxyacylglutathione hydrolase